MVTLVLAAVGVLSYLAYIPSLTIQQLISLFTECHNVIAWICAVAATARYFFSDDWDETLPKVSMIVIDVIAGADLAVKAVMWLIDLLGGGHETNEIIFWVVFLLIPVALLILNALFSKRYPGAAASEKMITVLLGAEAAVIALSFLLCFTNPVTSPYLSYKDMTFVIVSAVTGIQENFVPTFGNLAEWPLRMKLLLGVCVLLILESYMCDMRKSFVRFLDNVISNTTWYVITIYLMLALFKLRTFVYHSFWYFFVELAVVVAFGLVAYLLPFVLLFPNTAKTLSSAFGSIEKSIGEKERKVVPSDDLEEYKRLNSIHSLPEFIYTEDGKLLSRQWIDGDIAVYFDEDRREVIITGVVMYGNSAGTNIGNVHWYTH
ncbi:MAG: hypothetical protein PUH88_02000 [Lachnospiraceae bacterium]|nr:hypothetical protein [Lachnospiraceae bacterium]